MKMKLKSENDKSSSNCPIHGYMTLLIHIKHDAVFKIYITSGASCLVVF